MLGPDGGEGTKATGGLDVSDHTDDVHGWCFKNGDGFDDFFLVGFGTGAVQFSDNVGHTRFVSHEGRQMRRVGGIVFGKDLDAATVTAATFSRQETKRSVTRCFEFSVRHDEG